MEKPYNLSVVMIPEADLMALKLGQEEILHLLKELTAGTHGIDQPSRDYISAAAFMDAVGIKRTKFYALISENKIITIKKHRKVYVLASEVKRFFVDPTV